MSDKHVDEAKGRVKEAAGSISGNRRLKNDGKADRAKATVKDKTDKVVDALSGRGRKSPRDRTPANPHESTLGGDMVTIIIIVLLILLLTGVGARFRRRGRV